MAAYQGYISRYFLYTVVVGAVIYGILWLLETYVPVVAGWIYGSGVETGLGVAAVMLPGVYTGQVWWRQERRKMARVEGWGLAAAGALVALICWLGVIWFAARRLPEVQAMVDDLRSADGLIPMILGVTLVSLVLLIRLSLWLGQRGEERREEHLSQQQGR